MYTYYIYIYIIYIIHIWNRDIIHIWNRDSNFRTIYIYIDRERERERERDRKRGGRKKTTYLKNIFDSPLYQFIVFNLFNFVFNCVFNFVYLTVFNSLFTQCVSQVYLKVLMLPSVFLRTIYILLKLLSLFHMCINWMFPETTK